MGMVERSFGVVTPTLVVALFGCSPIVVQSGDSDSATTNGAESVSSSAGTSSSTTGAAPTTTFDPGATEVGSTHLPTSVEDSDLGGPTIGCNPFAPNCPAGQKCAPWYDGDVSFFNATKCVDIMGDGAPGEPCTAVDGGHGGIDDCAAGSICLPVDKENHGSCVLLCTGTLDDPQCPVGSTCQAMSEAIFGLCTLACDPLIQDCMGDALCVPIADGWDCMPDDSGAGGQVNDPCNSPNTCDKGLACLNVVSASSACGEGRSGCCQPFCEYPGSECPNVDQTCLPWYDPMGDVPLGYEDVGICAISK